MGQKFLDDAGNELRIETRGEGKNTKVFLVITPKDTRMPPLEMHWSRTWSKTNFLKHIKSFSTPITNGTQHTPEQENAQKYSAIIQGILDKDPNASDFRQTKALFENKEKVITSAARKLKQLKQKITGNEFPSRETLSDILYKAPKKTAELSKVAQEPAIIPPKPAPRYFLDQNGNKVTFKKDSVVVVKTNNDTLTIPIDGSKEDFLEAIRCIAENGIKDQDITIAQERTIQNYAKIINAAKKITASATSLPAASILSVAQSIRKAEIDALIEAVEKFNEANPRTVPTPPAPEQSKSAPQPKPRLADPLEQQPRAALRPAPQPPVQQSPAQQTLPRSALKQTGSPTSLNKKPVNDRFDADGNDTLSRKEAVAIEKRLLTRGAKVTEAIAAYEKMAMPPENKKRMLTFRENPTIHHFEKEDPTNTLTLARKRLKPNGNITET